MKKFLIGFIVFSLILFIFPAVAYAGPGVELGTTGDGTAEWTTEEAKFGDYSAKLYWPASSRAFATIATPSGLKISDINSWSYWIMAPEDYAPNLTFYLDTTGDGSSDVTISAWPENPDNVWTQIDQITIGGYQGAYVVWDSALSGPRYLFSWNDVVNGKNVWGVWLYYGDAEIMKVKIGKGVIGTSQNITTYVDDFTLTVDDDTTTYEFEPPPSPPSPPAPAEPAGYVQQTMGAGTYTVDASAVAGASATITGSGGQTVTIEGISSAAASAGGFSINILLSFAASSKTSAHFIFL